MFSVLRALEQERHRELFSFPRFDAQIGAGTVKIGALCAMLRANPAATHLIPVARISRSPGLLEYTGSKNQEPVCNFSM